MSNSNMKDIQEARNNSGRSKEIEMLFYVAMNKINTHIKESNLNCSTNIMFGGFIDELYEPVRLIYKKSQNIFIIYFSSHFMHNDNDKILNVIIRYIITTNKNNTFKTIPEIREEMKKLPFDTHYDVAFRNNYLVSDSPVTNGVICESCLRIYHCSTDSDMFKHVENYKCQCSPDGGKLALIINGKKQMDPKKMDFYKNLNLDDVNKAKKERELYQKALEQMLTEDDFEIDTFNEECLEIINKIIEENPKGVNRKPINEFIDKYVDNQDYMAMIAQAFPHQYYNAYRYSGYENQQKIINNPIMHPRWKEWDLETEKQRVEGKIKYAERQAAKPQNIEEIINKLDIKESTKKNLSAALENKGKKISRMKVAEYIEQAIATKDEEFINVMNDNFSEIYLESFKHMHKSARYYLYNNFTPKSENFNEEFKKKYPGVINEKRSIPKIVIERDPNADAATKLNTFMRMYKRIGNKELIHEVNDAVFHEDSEYIKMLHEAFKERFAKVRPAFSNSTLDYLDKIGL